MFSGIWYPLPFRIAYSFLLTGSKNLLLLRSTKGTLSRVSIFAIRRGSCLVISLIWLALI